MIEERSPLTWLQDWAMHMGWPAVVLASFMLGRYVKHLEHRVDKAEESIKQIVERHLPAIHNRLAQIHGLLMGKR